MCALPNILLVVVCGKGGARGRGRGFHMCHMCLLQQLASMNVYCARVLSCESRERQICVCVRERERERERVIMHCKHNNWEEHNSEHNASLQVHMMLLCMSQCTQTTSEYSSKAPVITDYNCYCPNSHVIWNSRLRHKAE